MTTNIIAQYERREKISRLIFSCNAMTNRSSTIMPTLSQKNLDTPMKYGNIKYEKRDKNIAFNFF